MKTYHLLTAFPKSIASYTNESIIKRARAQKYIDIKTHDLRMYTLTKHRAIDDTPYGGGPGMVLAVEPIYKCLVKIRALPKKKQARIILLSPRGKQFSAEDAKRLSRYRSLVFVCGRYEGVDERVSEHLADEILSIGPYVLSGGELPALVIIEAVTRLIPGVLGNRESPLKYDYPTYTKPERFYPDRRNKKVRWDVPPLLLSGNHKKISEWRKKRTTNF